MKMNIIKTGILFCTALFAFAACNDAAYQAVKNGVYINEAAPEGKFNKQIENLTVKGDMTTTIHVRLAQAYDKDVKVVLGLADDFVAEYNATYNTAYEALPSDYLSFDTEAVIPAGSLTSDAVNINIKKYPTGEGIPYCAPICIKSVDADLEIMPASGRIMYLLTAPLMQLVPNINAYTVPAGTGDGWGVNVSEWTLEGWVKMGSYTINNQAIFTGDCTTADGGWNEIYVRFGDANVDFDRMQIKTGGSQWESTMKFTPNTWYHVAITYANGKATLYLNGEEDSSKDITSTYIINKLTLCGSGSYFKTTAQMAQIRFWSKALSSSSIKDAMNREVSPSSEGLFGYWKLNEGQGGTFYDSTSNKFDLSCTNDPVWSTTEVDFTDPNAKE